MKFLKNNHGVVKNLHLAMSIILIIPISLIYGLYPNIILSKLFGFNIETINLANIFRAMMGLYMGMAAIWIIGITKPEFWVSATITNIVFMGGLAFGRLISLVVDGFPPIYFLTGLIVESALAFWGLKNLKKYGLNLIEKTGA